MIIFSFTYISLLSPKYSYEIPASGFVELCLSLVVSKTASYCTHTHIIVPQHFTNYFYLHKTRYSRATLSRTEKTNVCCMMFQYTDLRYCLQYAFHDGVLRIST
jgi:hypothetical protein